MAGDSVQYQGPTSILTGQAFGEIAQTGTIIVDEHPPAYTPTNDKDGVAVPHNASHKEVAATTVQSSYLPEKTGGVEGLLSTPGRELPDVYEVTLPRWRAAIRRALVRRVEWETKVIARMQDAVRTPWLDTYFVYTSTLGTHTFFMIFLPIFFLFGHEKMGRDLLMVLALGVYTTSFLKDLICSPRPFAPPVTRLTIGTHHLEYGFPSTHSTNSVSIALSLYAYLPHDSPYYWWCCAVLGFYTFSIVYGRLYTAMHSFTDCVMGVLMGAGISLAWHRWGVIFDTWLDSTGWTVPLIIVPMCLVMVNQHPQPVDDCPCFEDAIAFVSVMMGMIVARWHSVQSEFASHHLASVMPGAAWESWTDIAIFCGVAVLKLVVGILIIFVWRIAAKATLSTVLPPTFRLLAQGFTLPNRRFYTPATDYKSVPVEHALRPIPSVVDLPSQLEVGEEVGRVHGGGSSLGLGVGGWTTHGNSRHVKSRGVATSARGAGGIYPSSGGIYGSSSSSRSSSTSRRSSPSRFLSEKRAIDQLDVVKRYDADVLTKVVVYTGIAFLGYELVPIIFSLLGWGVRTY